MAKSISEIKKEFEDTDLEQIMPKLDEYRDDERSGVVKLIATYEKKYTKLQEEKERIELMKTFERDYIDYELVGGVDEVGRGPLAGPVVASCVIMPKGFYVEGITDSKQVSLKKRLEFNQIILDNAIAVATVFIDEKVIDEINIYEATKKAMLQTLEEIKIKPDYVLIDAMPLDFNIPHASIIKGDAKSFMWTQHKARFQRIAAFCRML